MSAPCVGDHADYPPLFSCTYAGAAGQWTAPSVRAQAEATSWYGAPSGPIRVFVECESPPTSSLVTIAGVSVGETAAQVITVSIMHNTTLLAFEGVAGGDVITIIPIAPPPSSPPPTPPPPPSSPPPDNVILARAVGSHGAAGGEWAATWAEVMAGKGESASWASNPNQWGWVGLAQWPASGTIEMRCLNVDGGTGVDTFSQTFTLDKGACETNNYAIGCATFDFQWDMGCYSHNGRGNSLSTTDLDRDNWATSNCAAASRSVWPTESAGWGWHDSCHCGSIYKYTGEPMCMGAGTDGSGYQTNGADRVEMWLMD
jgi:hypothetical protein